jgi:DNA-binding response OmpR family regulator
MDLVLVITKDSSIGQAVEKAIDPSKFLVWVSHSLQEARTMLGQQNTSAIIIDGQSDIDAGIEFIETIKLKLGKLTIPCVMLCAEDAKVDIKKCLCSGVDEVMVWPSPAEDIVQKIDQLLKEYEVHQGTRLLDYQRDYQSASGPQYDKHKGMADHIASSGGLVNLNQSGVSVDFNQSEPRIEAYKMRPGLKPAAINMDFHDDTPKTEIYHPPKHAEEENVPGMHALTPQFSTEHDDERGEDFHTDGMDAQRDNTQNAVEKALRQLTPERIDEMAAEILDRKLSEAARTNIRRIIAQSVREEVEKIIPDLVESLKAKL